ncbi:hypothetical protein OJAV_G00235320 [Oryzias javanicus]|uniref:C-type lectin domain-containing protein n=1 Tax=Oryzias javanicus TaxID=123683 RepID=A0A437BYI7_ORYJA|nr:hypothetical protein OJAV_G00235320 [Oryzias javanicus]
MSRQNTRNGVRQRRHLGKKAYIVIAVTVGLLCVLQAVLNISLRLSLTCSGETEKILKSLTNEEELKNVTNEEELKNVTNERDELMQKMTQHACSGGTEKSFRNVSIEEELKNVTNERDELKQKLEQYGMQLTSLRREKDELQTKVNLSDHHQKQHWIYFSGSFYYISTNKKSWQNSRNDCLGRGADLIIIDSREENEFAGAFQKRLWIGLSDRQNEGNWSWPDGSPLRKSFWQPWEPNGYSDRDEDCVEINNFDPENSWNDISCTEQNFWICEKKTGV